MMMVPALGLYALLHLLFLAQEYHVFVTDGFASKVSFDWNNDGGLEQYQSIKDGPIVARWDLFSNILYTNIDASCNNKQINDCINKGDYIFLPAGGFGSYRYDLTVRPGDHAVGRMNYHILDYTGIMDRVTRVWNTSTDANMIQGGPPYVENRYRIQVDKGINWDGSDLGSPWGDTVYSQPVGAMYSNLYPNPPIWSLDTPASRTGYQQMFKFTPKTKVTYVSECAGRGTCDRTMGLCQCFKGYTNYNCDTQSARAM